MTDMLNKPVTYDQLRKFLNTQASIITQREKHTCPSPPHSFQNRYSSTPKYRYNKLSPPIYRNRKLLKRDSVPNLNTTQISKKVLPLSLSLATEYAPKNRGKTKT